VRAADREQTPAAGWARGTTLRFHGGTLRAGSHRASRWETCGVLCRVQVFHGQVAKPRAAPLTRRDTMKRKRSVLPLSPSGFCFCFCFSKSVRARCLSAPGAMARCDAGVSQRRRSKATTAGRALRAGEGTAPHLGAACAAAGNCTPTPAEGASTQRGSVARRAEFRAPTPREVICSLLTITHHEPRCGGVAEPGEHPRAARRQAKPRDERSAAAPAVRAKRGRDLTEREARAPRIAFVGFIYGFLFGISRWVVSMVFGAISFR